MLKSLYSLKQAPLELYCPINKHLQLNIFMAPHGNPCICKPSKELIIIAIINNCVVIMLGDCIASIQSILHHGFLMKGLRPVQSILSLKVLQDKKAVLLQQSSKIQQMLHGGPEATHSAVG